MNQPLSLDPVRTAAVQPSSASGRDHRCPNLYIDVTDLISHLRLNRNVSGIQRVQCEIVRHLGRLERFSEKSADFSIKKTRLNNTLEKNCDSEIAQFAPARVPAVSFTAFGESGLGVVATSELADIIDRTHALSASSPKLPAQIRTLLEGALPANAQAGDLFLSTGAFWTVDGIEQLVRRLKSSRLTIGVFVHDILPISRPEYFEANTGKALVRPLVEVLALADFIMTSSSYNKEALVAYRRERNLDSIPIHVAPLGHGLPKPSAEAPETDNSVTNVVDSPFVLCVGTIEIRKNLPYLFNIWKLMVEAGRRAIPTLVLAGRKGWLVDDFLRQLEACNNLDGRIVLLHDLSDGALDLLYRRCLLTIFPSFDEGWGLPVGESLAHGKICLASGVGGVPEVGGACADYIDPYNARDGYDRLVRYLDDPELRTRREIEIAERFPMRSWQDFATEIMRVATANMDDPPRSSGLAAILLPPNEFLPIGRRMEGSSRQAVRGGLSAELACISGWSPPEAIGIAACEPLSVLQFRVGRIPHPTVVVVFRFSVSGSEASTIHIRSGSGAERRVSIEPGADRIAALSCESEQDGLVTVSFETMDNDGRSSWKLKGFLYIQPSVLTGAMFTPTAEAHGLQARGTAVSSQSADHAAPGPFIQATHSLAGSDDVHALAEFLRVPNSKWRCASEATIYRREPIFAHPAEQQLFLTRYRNSRRARLGAVRDDITLRRRNDQYVSTSRCTEGAIFDVSGVAKDVGYFEAAYEDAPWLTRNRTGIWIHRQALAEATHLDGRYAIFFNGNLHNYYHWMAEGLLVLDVMAQTIGEGLDFGIILPRTMDIEAVLDHRASLGALGLDRWPVVEAGPPMAKVREAVWLECHDFIEDVPAAHVRNFQRRIAAKYAERRGARTRRLLVKRLGPARAISNFEEVEAFLRPRGFETVWLDGRSVEEQIMLFQTAEFVAGAHGAGLTNLLFCEPGTKVIEFMPTIEMRPFFWLISEKLGLRHAMQFCPGIEGEGFRTSLRVDIGRLGVLYGLLDGDR